MTEGWFSFLYRHHCRPLFILFFLRLEIAIALRIKPGLGSLAANEQKVVGEGGVERRKDEGRRLVRGRGWEKAVGRQRGQVGESHNDDARYSKKKEENISLPRTVMNEKAEGCLISFFRFNKSLLPLSVHFLLLRFHSHGFRTGRLRGYYTETAAKSHIHRVALQSRRKKGAASLIKIPFRNAIRYVVPRRLVNASCPQKWNATGSSLRRLALSEVSKRVSYLVAPFFLFAEALCNRMFEAL